MIFPKRDIDINKGVDVTVVLDDVALEARLKSAFAEIKHIKLKTVIGPIHQHEHHLVNGSRPSLLIVELDPKRIEDLQSLDRLNRADLLGIPIIAISDGLDESTVRRLLHLGVADWLPKDVHTRDLLQSCQLAIQNRPEPHNKTDAMCYAFLPAAGGVGNSTLAIQSAFILARRNKKFTSTCLVDLNFQSGTVADYLDLNPGFEVDEIIATPERLDMQLLEVMLSRHRSGLAVLAAPRAATTPKYLSEEFVAAVLGLTSEMFDTVIIDLPLTWFPWTENVLYGSNNLFIVTEFTVPALRYAKALFDEINNKDINHLNCSIIVNKYRQRLLGSGLIKKDAFNLLGTEFTRFVAEDERLVREAINRGEPLSEIQRLNRIEKDLSRILAEGEHVVSDQ